MRDLHLLEQAGQIGECGLDVACRHALKGTETTDDIKGHVRSISSSDTLDACAGM